MTRSIGEFLMRLALWAMPRDRRDWARAMAREFEEVDDDGQALAWALGALANACRERGLPVLVFSGRLVVALLTGAYALFHLSMATNGIRILATGERPFRLTLLAYLAAMTVTHAGAAVFLVWWKPKPFFWFAGAALAVSLAIFVPGAVMTLRAPIWSYSTQTVLALMLIGSAMIFARLESSPRSVRTGPLPLG